MVAGKNIQTYKYGENQQKAKEKTASKCRLHVTMLVVVVVVVVYLHDNNQISYRYEHNHKRDNTILLSRTARTSVIVVGYNQWLKYNIGRKGTPFCRL